MAAHLSLALGFVQVPFANLCFNAARMEWFKARTSHGKGLQGCGCLRTSVHLQRTEACSDLCNAAKTLSQRYVSEKIGAAWQYC